jgi:hypothetical protein
MPRTHAPYAPEYRRAIIELAHAGLSINELAPSSIAKISRPPSRFLGGNWKWRGSIRTVVTYRPPHYLKKSLDFLSTHTDPYLYREICDATFPLSQAGEALDRSERREVTRAALLPRVG